MNIEELILNNIKMLREYQIAKKIKNNYLDGSVYRSNVFRKGLPKIPTIVELCKDFNISVDDFLTKELELKLVFKDKEQK